MISCEGGLAVEKISKEYKPKKFGPTMIKMLEKKASADVRMILQRV